MKRKNTIGKKLNKGNNNNLEHGFFSFFYEHRYLFLGIFLLLSVFLNQLILQLTFTTWTEALWYCDVAALVLGIGLLFRNKIISTFIFCTAIPAQFLWVTDFFLELVGFGLGRTTELASYGLLVFIFSLNLHFILIPIAFYAVYSLGFSKKAFLPGVLFILILLSTTFLLTSPAENVNCVFHGCDYHPPLQESRFDYFSYFSIHSLLFWLVMYVFFYFGWKYVFRNKLA